MSYWLDPFACFWFVMSNFLYILSLLLYLSSFCLVLNQSHLLIIKDNHLLLQLTTHRCFYGKIMAELDRDKVSLIYLICVVDVTQWSTKAREINYENIILQTKSIFRSYLWNHIMLLLAFNYPSSINSLCILLGYETEALTDF